VPNRQPSPCRAAHGSLPDIWLVSDVRNDARLETRLARLPRGSGLVFRHYHLDPRARWRRFTRLARIARRFGHCVVLAGSLAQARAWRAHGAYGAPDAPERKAAGLRMMTAHSLREIARANRAAADAVLLSPVHPTRSHPGAKVLGRARFRLLAARAQAPVIALGGMDATRARSLRWKKWAAIDGI